ncbi:MAG: Alpha-glucosidase, partial [Rubrobacteraceae bacterium]|nr:Alpha-glucosidase [Rubrobacteraceae bacterium]
MAEIFENPPQMGESYEPLGTAEVVDHDGRILRLRCGSTVVEVSVLAPDLFRVGAFPDGGKPRYYSEAIAKQDWEPVEVSMERSDGEITLFTSAASA